MKATITYGKATISLDGTADEIIDMVRKLDEQPAKYVFYPPHSTPYVDWTCRPLTTLRRD